MQDATWLSKTSPKRRSRLSRPARLGLGVMLALMLAMLLVLPAFLWAPVAPPGLPAPLRDWAFDVRLTIGPLMKSAVSVAGGSFRDDRVYLDRAGDPVRLEGTHPSLAATLYQAEGAPPHPAIVLVHGSTPEGRHLGLYRVLGTSLAERGYTVLSLDLRGYGESADPPTVQQPEAFDFVADVSAAVDYLLARESVDPERLYIVGHSFGGDVTLAAGEREPRLRKLVVIGPGRQFAERGGTVEAPEFEYFRRRDMRYMGLSEPIPIDVYLASRATLPIENHLDYYGGTHQPLALIEGELEGEADHQYLQQMYDRMSEPKELVTLANADHYANVANVGSLVFYDQRVVAQLVDTIDLWLRHGDDAAR